MIIDRVTSTVTPTTLYASRKQANASEKTPKALEHALNFSSSSGARTPISGAEEKPNSLTIIWTFLIGFEISKRRMITAVKGRAGGCFVTKPRQHQKTFHELRDNCTADV